MSALRRPRTTRHPVTTSHRAGVGKALVHATLMAALLAFSTSSAQGQVPPGGGGGGGTTVIGGFSQNAVGGVSINPLGILSNVGVNAKRALGELRRQSENALDTDISAVSELRKVSLRRLEKVIVDRLAKHEPLTDAMRLLAGLQRVRYVFVYPEQHDIVLAGPAEGWQIDAEGNPIGQQSGLPVLKLEDLIVAMRSSGAAPGSSFSCSIDPTQQGMRRLQTFLRSDRAQRMSPQMVSSMEKALGPQTISVSGVPATSHFARVMVAADYRMKRLAMNMDRSPVRGVPSYLQMASTRGSMTPRWWLAADYDGVWKDPAGLAWELQGMGVKAMAEDDFFSHEGVRQRSARANPMAQKWADNMTRHFAELARAIPIFGELQGCMDLAVVSALIFKEHLGERAGFEMSHLLSPDELSVTEFPAPRQVDTKASVLKKGHHWIISASGGVQISGWEIAGHADAKASLSEVQRQAAQPDAKQWWWD